jgi:methyl-accepting chemotaxis protein
MRLTASLSAKLITAFTVMILLLLVTAGVALLELRKSDIEADHIAENFLPAIENLGAMSSALNTIRRLEYGIIHGKDQAAKDSRLRRIAEHRTEFVDAMKLAAAMDMDDEERQGFATVQKGWEAYVAAEDATLALAVAGKTADALASIAAAGAVFNPLEEEITKLITINEQESATAKQEQDAAVARAYLWTSIAAAVAVVIGIVTALLLSRSILWPVTEVKTVLLALADGDLRRRAAVTGTDELAVMAQTLNRTMDGLGATVGRIAAGSQSIAGAAEELSAISQQLTGNAETVQTQSHSSAAASTEISQSLSTVATAVEELGASVGEIAGNAGQAATVAKEGVAATEEANAAMTRLDSSSTEIGEIVKLIASISEQTNLLALNATIEAARAGEAGRGFAVVAGEVKELARKTNEATGNIANKVGGIQSEAKATQESLHRILTIVRKISELQQSIAGAVEEQSATTKEFSGNISQVSQAGSRIASSTTAVANASKEAATGASQTAKAATALAQQAEGLRAAVARFTT